MIRILLIILVSFASLTAVSCGPEQSADEMRRKNIEDNNDEQTKVRKAELERIAERRRENIEQIEGIYKAVYRRGDTTIRARVELNYIEVETTIPNSSESVFMPEIRATLMSESSDGSSGVVSYSKFGANDNASAIVLRSQDDRFGLDLRLVSRNSLTGRIMSPQFDTKIDLTRQ